MLFAKRENQKPTFMYTWYPRSPYLEAETVKLGKYHGNTTLCGLWRWADSKPTFFNYLNDANVPTSDNLAVFVLELHLSSTETFLKSLIMCHFQPTFGNLSRERIEF